MISRIKSYIKIEHLMYAAWTIALVATVGSWGLSEIMHLPPCSLCWIQRIFMYPLALIMPIGILRRDPDLPYYVLPLSVGGMIVAFYHTLLQWGLISESGCTVRGRSIVYRSPIGRVGICDHTFWFIFEFCGGNWFGRLGFLAPTPAKQPPKLVTTRQLVYKHK
ncbi:disulfide bond formation protein B [bacterium]|nr:MAG: disulfide bond formation protein B [bacterium]